MVQGLIEGEETGGETIDDRAAFLEQNYSQVCRLFEKENVAATEKALNHLERERAKRLFPQAFDAEDERNGQ